MIDDIMSDDVMDYDVIIKMVKVSCRFSEKGMNLVIIQSPLKCSLVIIIWNEKVPLTMFNPQLIRENFFRQNVAKMLKNLNFHK